jgi:hypothetical protein
MGYNFDDLSITVKRKTNKIKSLKEKLDARRKNLFIPCGLFTLLLFYILFISNRYFSYINDYFNNVINQTNSKSIDLFLLGLLFLIGLVSYSLLILYGKTKKEYEDLRQDLIKTINNEFCIHKSGCTCKDGYIRDMDSYGIDMVFI